MENRNFSLADALISFAVIVILFLIASAIETHELSMY